MILVCIALLLKRKVILESNALVMQWKITTRSLRRKKKRSIKVCCGKYNTCKIKYNSSLKDIDSWIKLDYHVTCINCWRMHDFQCQLKYILKEKKKLMCQMTKSDQTRFPCHIPSTLRYEISLMANALTQLKEHDCHTNVIEKTRFYSQLHQFLEDNTVPNSRQ
jgi:hypothetical protein